MSKQETKLARFAKFTVIRFGLGIFACLMIIYSLELNSRRALERAVRRDLQAVELYHATKHQFKEQPQCFGCQIQFLELMKMALGKQDRVMNSSNHIHKIPAHFKETTIVKETTIDMIRKNALIQKQDIDLKSLREALVELGVFAPEKQ